MNEIVKHSRYFAPLCLVSHTVTESTLAWECDHNDSSIYLESVMWHDPGWLNNLLGKRIMSWPTMIHRSTWKTWPRTHDDSSVYLENVSWHDPQCLLVYFEQRVPWPTINFQLNRNVLSYETRPPISLLEKYACHYDPRNLTSLIET